MSYIIGKPLAKNGNKIRFTEGAQKTLQLASAETELFVYVLFRIVSCNFTQKFYLFGLPVLYKPTNLSNKQAYHFAHKIWKMFVYTFCMCSPPFLLFSKYVSTVAA